MRDALIVQSALQRELFVSTINVDRCEIALEDARLTGNAIKIEKLERHLLPRLAWKRRCEQILASHEARYGLCSAPPRGPRDTTVKKPSGIRRSVGRR